jgi:hypothetical protein
MRIFEKKYSGEYLETKYSGEYLETKFIVNFIFYPYRISDG